jgi:glycosyltransferase involved in cell wall biosynthesis
MGKNLKIVVEFFYPDVDADAQFAYDLAKGFTERGENVQVICQRGLKFVKFLHSELKKSEVIHGIEIHRLPDAFSNRTLIQKFLRHSLFYISLVVKLFNSTSRNSRLLVVSTPPYNGFIAALIKAFKNYKYFFAIKDIYPDVMVSNNIIKNNGLIYRFLNWATQISYRYAENVFTLGPYMTEKIRNKVKADNKVVEIPNWGFDELYPMERKNNPLVEELNLKGKFIVLYSGNHGYGHEFETVLESAKILSKDYNDIYFVFIGGGVRFNEIQEYKRNNPDANILTFDYLPFEKLNYGLNLADVSIITMRNNWKGMMVPSKTYGIMAVGSPIVYIGPESDISWTIERFKCGYIVKNGNVDEFIKRIKELYNNKKLRKNMGLKARRGFEKEYTKKKIMEKYLSVLNSNKREEIN